MLRMFLTGILLCGSSAFAQASMPEPQYSQQYNAIVNGKLTVLELQTAVTDTKSKRFFVIAPSTAVFESINNPASSVRVAPTTHFVVRLAMGDRDSQAIIHLQKLTPGKKDRQVPIVTYKVSLIPGAGVNHKRAPDESIPVTVQKYGNGSLEVTPQQPLEPGEYAFISGREAQCFGVDVDRSRGDTSSSQSGAVTATPPASAVSPRPIHPASSVLDLAPAAPGFPPMHASAPAQDGCWWVPFFSGKLGLEAAVSHCETEVWAVVAGETDTGITLAGPGATSAPEQVLTIKTKLAGQSMEAAIKQQFIMKLKEPAARLSCRATCETGTDGLNRCTVQATGSYAKLKRFHREDDSSDEPCPGLATNDAFATYFLERPTESKTKYLFYQADDLGAGLNETTIHFYAQP